MAAPYDPTSALKVPGESKMNRFRFTFISPAISDADINAHIVNPYILWSPETQLPAKYTFFQQETYAMPSYGENSDYAAGTTQHGTPLKYNYRLRGIPTGTYSLLAQAIPVVGIMPMAGGASSITSSMLTRYTYFPGSDFAVYFKQSLTITESLFNPPAAI